MDAKIALQNGHTRTYSMCSYAHNHNLCRKIVISEKRQQGIKLDAVAAAAAAVDGGGGGVFAAVAGCSQCNLPMSQLLIVCRKNHLRLPFRYMYLLCSCDNSR